VNEDLLNQAFEFGDIAERVKRQVELGEIPANVGAVFEAGFKSIREAIVATDGSTERMLKVVRATSRVEGLLDMWRCCRD
jgi:hypothetical protein